MAELVKVCVKVPAGKEAEVKSLAGKLREQAGSRTPGWDAKKIHWIAKNKFGSLEAMFVHHGWSERGIRMMPTVQRRVFEEYGSIEKFVDLHSV